MVDHLDFGRWDSLRGYGAFAARDNENPLVIQFSGGRTSAFMTAMAPDEAMVFFENTGVEDEKTLEFVQNVGESLGIDIVWLEMRPPVKKGARPRDFRWERVNFKTASRKGEPFEDFMRCINEYRDSKGEPHIAPWVNGRICTTHLKHRVLDHYLTEHGIEAHDRWLGLRADEPDRVRKLQAQETRTKGLLAPLHTAGIDKPTILDFWSRQPFDLGLEEEDGNCRGCFLKDMADVSRSIGKDPWHVEWWSRMQETYSRFGGEKWPSYRVLAEQRPMRLAIEGALREGADPIAMLEASGATVDKRVKLIVRQEVRRFENGPTQFSCACESSMGGGLEEDDELSEDDREAA